MSMYCEYCGEHDPLEGTGENTFIEIDIRPYDIFCCDDCINNHINDIENGEWSNHDRYNQGLESFYKKEIKNNWIGYPFRLIAADSGALIKEGKIGEVKE